MKKILCLLMLTGISFKHYAQQNMAAGNRVFDLPPNSVTRSATIELGKGNKLQLDISGDVLNHVNVDSLAKLFMQDMELLKDSLWEEPSSKHLFYTTGELGNHSLLMRQYKPEATYLVKDGQPSLLKLEQDTVTITGKVMTPRAGNKTPRPGYYRFTFYLNYLAGLATFADGSLQQKIRDSLHGKTWIRGSDGIQHLKNNPMIYAKGEYGNVTLGPTLNFLFSVSLQNYKSYFVSSFDMGFAYVTTNAHARQKFWIASEQHSLFARDNTSDGLQPPHPGKLKPYGYQFLTFGYERTSLAKPHAFPLSLSAAFLVDRSGGDYFDKGTVRLGLGKVYLLGGKTTIEPLIYTSGIFRSMSPGLRLTQSF